jgi:hypothetical protein
LKSTEKKKRASPAATNKSPSKIKKRRRFPHKNRKQYDREMQRSLRHRRRQELTNFKS